MSDCCGTHCLGKVEKVNRIMGDWELDHFYCFNFYVEENTRDVNVNIRSFSLSYILIHGQKE